SHPFPSRRLRRRPRRAGRGASWKCTRTTWRGNQSPTRPCGLLDSDDVDLDERCVVGQDRLDRRSRGGNGREEFRVDLIHCLKVTGVLEEHCCLHGAVKTRSRGREDGAEVLQDSLGLRLDIAFNHLIGDGITRELSSDKDEATSLDGL